MSQEKVNRHKEEKANRKKNMAKAKRKRILTYVIVAVVIVLIAAWIVYSAINSYTRSQATKQTPVNTDAVSNYLMELNSSEDADEEDTDSTADDTADEDTDSTTEDVAPQD